MDFTWKEVDFCVRITWGNGIFFATHSLPIFFVKSISSSNVNLKIFVTKSYGSKIP